MAKKNNGTTTFRLILLPPPAERLTAEQALEWLEGPHRVYTQMLEYDQSESGLLGLDLREMLEACTAAIRGDGIRLEKADNPRDLDFLEQLTELAALASLPSIEGWGDGDTWELVRPDLFREVARRIGLLSHHAIAAPAAQG